MPNAKHNLHKDEKGTESGEATNDAFIYVKLNLLMKYQPTTVFQKTENHLAI